MCSGGVSGEGSFEGLVRVGLCGGMCLGRRLCGVEECAEWRSVWGDGGGCVEWRCIPGGVASRDVFMVMVGLCGVEEWSWRCIEGRRVPGSVASRDVFRVMAGTVWSGSMF